MNVAIYEPTQLSGMSSSQLRNIGRNLQVPRFSVMDKSELAEAIVHHQESLAEQRNRQPLLFDNHAALSHQELSIIEANANRGKYAEMMENIARETDATCCNRMRYESISVEHGKFRCATCGTTATLEATWQETPVSEIERIEKMFKVKITDVLSARKNGRGYKVDLQGVNLNTGEVNEISTSLSVESLEELGWQPVITPMMNRLAGSSPKANFRPVHSSAFWTQEIAEKVNSQPTSSVMNPKAISESPEIEIPDHRDYNRKLYYASLRSLVKKGALVKVGLDFDMMKEYVYRKYGVISLTKLSESELAEAAAQTQAMTTKGLRESRLAEVKEFLNNGQDNRFSEGKVEGTGDIQTAYTAKNLNRYTFAVFRCNGKPADGRRFNKKEQAEKHAQRLNQKENRQRRFTKME